MTKEQQNTVSNATVFGHDPFKDFAKSNQHYKTSKEKKDEVETPSLDKNGLLTEENK